MNFQLKKPNVMNGMKIVHIYIIHHSFKILIKHQNQFKIYNLLIVY